ncbi:MAG: hypothetical protein V4449_02490 [Patescibacteria group bacterium]
MNVSRGTQKIFWITGIIFCVVTTFTFLTGTVTSVPSVPVPSVAVPSEGPIAISGVMLCLPHNNVEGPQTSECAYGLKDDSERYFMLLDSDPNYLNIIRVPMNVRVKVEGMFGPHNSSKYRDIGIISATKVTALDVLTASGE